MKPISDWHRNVIKRCEANNIETDIVKRWEQGIPHHPLSEETGSFLESVDWLFCDNFFDWKFGGDGDNGEFLLYELDIMYELLDKEEG